MQKRTKKITAVKKKPDIYSGFAEILRNSFAALSPQGHSVAALPALKQRRISERSGLLNCPGGIFFNVERRFFLAHPVAFLRIVPLIGRTLI